MTINYIFTDWQQSQTKSNNKSYPPFRAASRQYPLWSLEETEDCRDGLQISIYYPSRFSHTKYRYI